MRFTRIDVEQVGATLGTEISLVRRYPRGRAPARGARATRPASGSAASIPRPVPVLCLCGHGSC